MLKNITRIVYFSLASSLLIQTAYAESTQHNSLKFTEEMLEQQGTGFASLEHKNMGDSVKLHLPFVNSADEFRPLTMPNGLKLTYGEIVMYAADMFGNPAGPISSCAEKDRQACFKSQFDAMAVQGGLSANTCSNPVTQAKQIKIYMDNVSKELTQARSEGVEDWIYYEKHDVELTTKMNKFTCGGSPISRLLPFGNYIKLAKVNLDHFAPDSLIAYKAGHEYALKTALKGYEKRKAGLTEESNQLLELAYAQNAFANHYLTDSFSAGHMRTPRRAIDRQVHLPAVLSLLIANLMHNEENRHGLNVVNAEGTSWVAYGDGYLFKPEADLQKEVIQDAMQRSADSVYEVFISGKIPKVYAEMTLFPDYDKLDQLNDTAPLFKVENGVLLKRVNNNDYYDHHWTKYWSGLVVLMHFKSFY